MSNNLPIEKQTAIIAALAECNSIRGIERMFGTHRDTIMRLGVAVGNSCAALLDARMRGLPCKRIEVDEVWGFVGKKGRTCTPEDKRAGMGDVWTFLAIDADSKLIPSYHVGLRTAPDTHTFIRDLSSRLRDTIQLSSDGLPSYFYAIAENFEHVDYAQVVKEYSEPTREEQRRYSPPSVVSMEKISKLGAPDMALASTSYVERVNLTTRLHVKRLARLTLSFSKKRANFVAAIGLYLAYYNFCKKHSTVGMTPAMAAGLEDHEWTVAELLHAIA